MRRLSSIASLLLITAICWLGFQPGSALAHKVSYVSVAASFETEARTFSIEMAMEVDPTEDAVLNAQISPEQAATTFATEVLSLYFGDTELSVTPKIRVIEPEPDDIDPNFPERTKVVATLAGDIPEAADYFTLHLSEDNEATAIMVHFVDGDPGRRAEVLYPGEFSNPIYLRKTIKADPFAANPEAEKSSATEGKESTNAPANTEISANPENGEGMSAPAANDADADADADDAQSTPQTPPFVSGFRQVLPQNYPILICLLALFFFRRHLGILIIQLALLAIALFAAFALAFEQVVDLGEKAELLPIAALLGTALLALENLFHNKLRWWRLGMIVVTGCAFGFWFNEVATELTDPLNSTGELILHLLGIGAAMAASIAILYVAVAGVRKRPWYRKSLAFPASLIALGLALFWILLGS